MSSNARPTHDTPEAALAAALHRAKRGCGTVCQFVDSPEYADQRPQFETIIVRDHTEAAAAILAALDGWTLVNAERLAVALHYAMCDVSHHDGGPMGHDCHSWPKYPAIARTTMRALVVEP